MSVAPQTYQQGYSGIAKSLHWIVALGVLIVIPMGILMARIPDGPVKNNMFEFHKSLGAVVLLVMTLRIIYRIIKGAPPEPRIPAFYRVAGTVTHWALYALLLAVPMVAWVGYSAYGLGVPVFGLFELPILMAKNEELSHTLFVFHKYLGYALGVLMVMHIGAGLFHYFIRKDGVLERMLPGK